MTQAYMDQRYYHPFICPDGHEENPLWEAICRVYSKEMMRQFLDTFAWVFQEHSPTLLAALNELSDFDNLPIELTYNHVFGTLSKHLQEETKAHEAVILQGVELGLLFAYYGLYAQPWQASWDEPHSFVLGAFFLPPCRKIHFQDGRIHLDDSRILTLGMGQCKGYGATALLSLTGEDGGLWLWPFHDLDDTELAEYCQTGRKADKLLTLFPAYRTWVRQGIRYVVPLPSQGNSIRSGSLKHRTGVVEISMARTPVDMAEMLVHEASHQVFNVLSRFAQVEDGTDPKGYFSPPVNRNRPLERVIFAFHAFGNIVHFLNGIKPSLGEGVLPCERNIKRIMEEVHVLVAAMQDNHALTPLGTLLRDEFVARLGL